MWEDPKLRDSETGEHIIIKSSTITFIFSLLTTDKNEIDIFRILDDIIYIGLRAQRSSVISYIFSKIIILNYLNYLN